jgi:GTP-binding protein
MTEIRNIALIAHVDHGKTTLVDKLLQQSGTLHKHGSGGERMLDSNALEQERGITILAKNTAITWQSYRINIVDTPGHADFGGEVERILSMVDSVLLLVDAVEGPMPQTRFVTQKAFQRGLNPIVVINKIDRSGARPDWVVDKVFDLFVELNATDQQLDFPIIYASALTGYAQLSLTDPQTDLTPLFQTIIEQVPAPNLDPEGPLQMQISALDYSSYVGTMGIGRINRGRIRSKMPVKVVTRDNKVSNGRILQILRFNGLEREEAELAEAGDIVCIAGIEGLQISSTLCDPSQVEALPALNVDEPTIQMIFQINDSPFAGQDGKYVTSRRISDRLQQELLHNVALRVTATEHPDKFAVAGRGELHLGILIENMRRENYELAISRPFVVFKEEDGKLLEPYERLTLDIESMHQGSVIEIVANRKAKLLDLKIAGHGRIHLDYMIPTRGLIGLHQEILLATAGSGLMHHIFDHYGERCPPQHGRKAGALIAKHAGRSTGYALWNVQQRGKLFIGPQTEVYAGMIVGEHSRENDLVVNVTKEKQLTNVRASGTDDNIVLTPTVKFSLEQALEWINDDELVEVTPLSIRLRKRYLQEHERKRQK